MRITYRSHGGSRPYWEKRWAQLSADAGKLKIDRYPGKYAEMIMRSVDGEVLEAGCGAGRVLLHYHRLGRRIVGMDFIETALTKIRKINSSVPLFAGDVTHLPFCNERFSAVLAFGLYHSLERDIDLALGETRRVMKENGMLCASVRMDNIQNRIVDWFADRGTDIENNVYFHKVNFTEKDYRRMLAASGFAVESIEYVENMPLLYKFAIFRHASHRKFNEHLARGEGYRLSWYGSALQRLLITISPRSFCNVMIAIARAV